MASNMQPHRNPTKHPHFRDCFKNSGNLTDDGEITEMQTHTNSKKSFTIIMVYGNRY
jgi:hypothetical protein